LGAEGFTPLHCLRHGDLLLTVDRIHTRPAEADRSILVVPLTGPPQHHFGGTADATTTGHRDHSGRPGGEHSHSWTVLPLCAQGALEIEHPAAQHPHLVFEVEQP